MIKPFLSVVTISFNQAQYLRQCVDSVVSQKGDDVEYIVVDPGSSDGSREILASYGAAIDRLVLEPDKGPADGLNKGFAQAKGDIGYFINSDDFLLPGAIDRMRRLWAVHDDIEVLLGGAWMVDGDGQPTRELSSTSISLSDLLNGRSSLVQQGMSFRLSSFKRAGEFNPENRTCWDYELLCALLRTKAIAKVTADRFGAFRIYGESLSGGVGGEAHTSRYLADLDRIHHQMTGRPRQPKGLLTPTCLGRVARLFDRPRHRLLCARDWLFPAAMHRRWQQDLRRPLAKV